MKKNRTKILSLLLVALFIFFAVASGSDESTEAPKDQGTETVAPTQAVDDGSIGDYAVEIVACRLSKDYEGKDVAIITYNFTNVSADEPTSFMFAFDDKVYQNGIECEYAIITDDDSYDESNQLKEIKAGATLEVEVAYVLNDTTSDVEVEIAELISFDDTVITKTFVIAE